MQDVQANTPTRFWVNNPSREDSQSAIDAGAVAVTTNPAFCAKLLETEPDHIKSIVSEVIATESDDSAAAEKIYHQASKVLMDQWLPVYEEASGERGFVTIQEDPRREENPDYIVEASKRATALGPNYMAKVPVTVEGLAVIEQLVALNIPICATEIFAISQYRALLEIYEKASRNSGNSPTIYVTHITGILDEYFQGVASKEKPDIDPELLAKAGTIIGLREYELWQESSVAHRLLGGGARGLGHFTNFVGSDLDVTMNWSTIEELNASYSAHHEGAFEEPSESEIQELRDKLPNFARALDDDGVATESFADFGPVMLFRTQFLNGYARLLDAIGDARYAQ